jgi:hypothetical protein
MVSRVLWFIGAATAIIVAVFARWHPPDAVQPVSVAMSPAATAVQPTGRTVPAGTSWSDSADNRVRTADPAVLLRLLREREARGASRHELFEQLRGLTAGRPDLALEIAQVFSRDDDEKTAWETDLVRVWARADREAAWQWIAAQGTRLEKFADGSLLSVVLNQIAQDDPAMVTTIAENALRAPSSPGQLASQIVAQAGVEALLRNDGLDRSRELVEHWARDPQGLDAGLGAFAAVAARLAESGPEKGAAWLQSLPPSESRNAALATAAAEWAVHDPATALTWSDALPEADGRSAVVQRAFGEWVELDALNAARWLGDRLAAGATTPEADNLIANLIHQSALTKSNPASAMHWAGLMSDPAARAALEEHVLLRWGNRDPLAASAYVGSVAGLTPERRVALQQKITAYQAAPESVDLWFAADNFGSSN